MRRNYGVACTGSAAAGPAVVHKSSVCIAPGTLPFVSLCVYVCVCIVYTRIRVQTYLYTYIHRERLRRRRGKLLSLSLISADSMNMERLLKWLNSRNSLSHTHTHTRTHFTFAAFQRIYTSERSRSLHVEKRRGWWRGVAS